jgi:hypothetical protein
MEITHAKKDATEPDLLEFFDKGKNPGSTKNRAVD